MTSPRTLRAPLIAALAALSLTAAACGDDDESTTDSTAADTTAPTETSTDAAPTTSATTDSAAASTSPEGTATDETAAAGPADRDAFVEAGMASIGAMAGEGGECLVDGVVDSVGVDMLNETGLSPEEFWASPTPLAESGLTTESPEIEQMAEAIGACDGLLGAFAAAAGAEPTDEEVACMEDAGAQELVGQVLAYNLIGAETTELDEAGDAMSAECGIS